MKIAIAISLPLLLAQLNWIDYLNHTISKIDVQAKIVKHKIILEDNGKVELTAYKLKPYRKEHIKIVFTSKYTSNIDYTVYSTKQLDFAKFDYFISYLFYKGVKPRDAPTCKMIDSKIYFKPDSTGIEFTRELDIYDNQNIDSLKQELKKQSYTQKALAKKDYIKNSERLKRVKNKI